MPTITTVYRGDMLFEAAMGRHRLLLDVPQSVGGKDRAPTSIELFVASLGSCIAAFVAGYCERSGLPTDDMSVDVSFEQAEEPTRLVDLEVTINLPYADVGDRWEAIRRIAEHCPVHETVEYTLEDIDLEIRDRTKFAAGAT